MKQAGFLVERVVGPANVQTAGRHLKISGELDLHAVRVDLGGSTGLDNFLNRLHASPDAGEAAQGKGVHAQVQNLLHTGRKEHRRATGLEDVVALVHGGGAFGHVVVAGHCYHATPGGGARHVGVLENIAAAVNAWAFAVPDAKHAIKLVGARRRKPQLLRAPQSGGRQLFIHARLEHDVLRLQVLLGLDQRLVIAAQRRASVAADKTRRVFTHLRIAHALQHGQSNQRLHPTHESAPVVERVFVVQRHAFQRLANVGGQRCIHDFCVSGGGQ